VAAPLQQATSTRGPPAAPVYRKDLAMGAVSRAIARQPVPGRDHLLRVIASEYREMPGMRLTPSQFGRLWNLGAAECVEVVRELIRRGDLSEDDDGRIGSRCDVM